MPRPTVAFVPQARAQAIDNFVKLCEKGVCDLDGTDVVRRRVRSEALYMWKNHGIFFSTINTALEIAGQAIRFICNAIPGLGDAK